MLQEMSDSSDEDRRSESPEEKKKTKKEKKEKKESSEKKEREEKTEKDKKVNNHITFFRTQHYSATSALKMSRKKFWAQTLPRRSFDELTIIF